MPKLFWCGQEAENQRFLRQKKNDDSYAKRFGLAFDSGLNVGSDVTDVSTNEMHIEARLRLD